MQEALVKVVSGYRLSVRKFAKALKLNEGDYVIVRLFTVAEAGRPGPHLEVMPAEVKAK